MASKPTWSDIHQEQPEKGDVVLVFDAPTRVLAQWYPQNGNNPWNMMDGRYKSTEEVFMWHPIADHPYEQISEEALQA